MIINVSDQDLQVGFTFLSSVVNLCVKSVSLHLEQIHVDKYVYSKVQINLMQMPEANDNNYQNRGKKKQKVQNLKKLRRSAQNITVTYDLTNKQREKLQE